VLLNKPGKESRIARIARGSGRSIKEVPIAASFPPPFLNTSRRPHH
jgi:hypothetical protein